MSLPFFPDRPQVRLLTVQYARGSIIGLPSPRFAERAQLAAMDCSRSTDRYPSVTYTVRVTRRACREIGEHFKHSPDVRKVAWLKIPG